MAEGFASKPTVTVGEATKKADYDNLVDFVAGSEWLDGDAGYTFVVADFGKTARVNAGGAQTVNLPSVAAANIGGKLAVVKLGAGNVTIQAADNDSIADGAAAGTLINSTAAETFAYVILELATATKWIIVGGHGTWVTSASTFKFGAKFLDEDNMASDDAAAVASQQSIKAYVDPKIANVVEDTTPQLGGELDCQAHSVGFTQQTATGDGTTTIDWKLGNKFFFTYGAQNETFTFTAPSNPCSLILVLKQDGTGSRTPTWPATVKWPNTGTEPIWSTGANKVDIVSLYYDGTNYWSMAGLDFA